MMDVRRDIAMELRATLSLSLSLCLSVSLSLSVSVSVSLSVSLCLSLSLLLCWKAIQYTYDSLQRGTHTSSHKPTTGSFQSEFALLL